MMSSMLTELITKLKMMDMVTFHSDVLYLLTTLDPPNACGCYDDMLLHKSETIIEKRDNGSYLINFEFRHYLLVFDKSSEAFALGVKNGQGQYITSFYKGYNPGIRKPIWMKKKLWKIIQLAMWSER